MAREGWDDRRSGAGDFRTEPRSSPGSMVVLTVSAVLLVTAAATAIFGGGGFDDATPHGRLLGTLGRVAEAQQEYHRETGTFAAWERTLSVEVAGAVQFRLIRATAESWEAMVEDDDVGLSCVQKGRWDGERQVVEQAVCYR